MGLSTRVSNGWEVAKASLKVLNAHKELIIFPILSGISILLVIAAGFGFAFNSFGWRAADTGDISSGAIYLVLFVFYVVNYFIVVFFNMGLMYCAKCYFDGADTSVAKGLKFSLSRIHYIFLWAVFAGTVGTLLRMVQDKLGWLGKLFIGLIGLVWSAATFFVIPILAYENVGPAEALKRSTGIMKEKWGTGITANFSIGLISFLVMILIAIAGTGISTLVNEQAGIVVMCLGILAVILISSALQSILISAIYNQVSGNDNQHFADPLIKDLFVEK